MTSSPTTNASEDANWIIPQEIQCPLCGEKDFDAVGFKMHIKRNWCDALEGIANE